MEDPTPPKRHPGGVWDPVSTPGCLRAPHTSGAFGWEIGLDTFRVLIAHLKFCGFLQGYSGLHG